MPLRLDADAPYSSARMIIEARWRINAGRKALKGTQGASPTSGSGE